MRALCHTRYGDRDRLQVREIPAPVPKADEVLVRVKATSVHADIWHVLTGKPYFLRLMGAGLLGPGGRVPGTDLAGVVEAVGTSVTRFKAGDLVYGECVRGHQWKHGGSYAELAVCPQAKLAPKPPLLSFEQAAALPTSVLIACQAVMDEGRLQAGESVLVNGAAGAVGGYAAQLALALGAELSVVDLPERLPALEALGAVRVLDGAAVDYTQGPERYDLIVDIPGNHAIDACLAALKPGGRYVYIGHDGFGKLAGPWLGSMRRMLRLFWALWRSGRGLQFPQPPDYPARFELIKRLVAEGRLRPSVARSFPLEQAEAALACLLEGKLDGRVVLTP